MGYYNLVAGFIDGAADDAAEAVEIGVVEGSKSGVAALKFGEASEGCEVGIWQR